MQFRLDSDDPAGNIPLMTAIGRLVVRASELEEQITAAVLWISGAQPCDGSDTYPVVNQTLNRRMLSWKLIFLKNTTKRLTDSNAQVGTELSDFGEKCLQQLQERNSRVHSTYLIDEDVISKWDPRRGPEQITPDDIEKDAEELRKLTDKAVEYYLRLRRARECGSLKKVM